MAAAIAVLTDSAAVTQRAAFPITRRMVESLRELHRVLGRDKEASGLAALAEHLDAGGAIEPAAYGHYFVLVRTLQDDAPASIRLFITELAQSARTQDAGIAIRMYGRVDFSRSALREVSSQFASTSLLSTQMGVIPTCARCRVRHKLSDALKLIQTHAPHAWHDVSAITTEIIAVYGRSQGLMTFDGCSSLERYGAVLVNMRRQRSVLTMAETLVHESAHSLLFALSCNDYRVLNPSTERFASPLRLDPRPLDGIYHAVFVLARMYSFLAEVVRHPQTTKAIRAEALKVMDVRRKNFLDGYAVLIENARFTQTGRQLIDETHAIFMEATRDLQKANAPQER